MEDAALWIALRNVKGLKRAEAWQLLERYGSPAAVFAERPSKLADACSTRMACRLARGPDLERARAELRVAERLGLCILLPGTHAYPGPLSEIPDRPLLLYALGSVPKTPALAIVGSRRASPRGRENARRLAAHAAAAGVSIVSGLAYGIDAAAHLGALDVGGLSVAVLASGLDRPSPSGNRRLAQRVLDAGGAWLSEYPPGELALPYRFPERNRLISGLALATLIVEARERSGSLWTMRHALDQGRDVLVVPGPIDSDACRGSNRLLRDGAKPILDGNDLLQAVRMEHSIRSSTPATPQREIKASAVSTRLLGLLADADRDPDELARELQLAPAKLSALLLELELGGHIRQQGTRVTLVHDRPRPARR